MFSLAALNLLPLDLIASIGLAGSASVFASMLFNLSFVPAVLFCFPTFFTTAVLGVRKHSSVQCMRNDAIINTNPGSDIGDDDDDDDALLVISSETPLRDSIDGTSVAINVTNSSFRFGDTAAASTVPLDDTELENKPGSLTDPCGGRSSHDAAHMEDSADIETMVEVCCMRSTVGGNQDVDCLCRRGHVDLFLLIISH